MLQLLIQCTPLGTGVHCTKLCCRLSVLRCQHHTPEKAPTGGFAALFRVAALCLRCFKYLNQSAFALNALKKQKFKEVPTDDALKGRV
jgi:hypothetical protein